MEEGVEGVFGGVLRCGGEDEGPRAGLRFAVHLRTLPPTPRSDGSKALFLGRAHYGCLATVLPDSTPGLTRKVGLAVCAHGLHGGVCARVCVRGAKRRSLLPPIRPPPARRPPAPPLRARSWRPSSPQRRAPRTGCWWSLAPPTWGPLRRLVSHVVAPHDLVAFAGCLLGALGIHLPAGERPFPTPHALCPPPRAPSRHAPRHPPPPFRHAAKRILNNVAVQYSPSGQLARRMGVSPRQLGRITGGCAPESPHSHSLASLLARCAHVGAWGGRGPSVRDGWVGGAHPLSCAPAPARAQATCGSRRAKGATIEWMWASASRPLVRACTSLIT